MRFKILVLLLLTTRFLLADKIDSVQIIKSSNKSEYEKSILLLDFYKLNFLSYKNTILKDLNQGLVNFKERKDTARIAQTYNILGNFYRFSDKTDISLTYYLKALYLNESSKNYRDLLNNLGNISQIYYYLDDIDNAFKYSSKIIPLAERIKDTLSIVWACVDIGSFNLKLKKYEEAKIYLNNALNLSLLKNILYGIAYSHLGFAEISYHEGDYHQAKNHAVFAYNMLTNYPIQLGFLQSQLALGNSYLKLHQLDSSEKYYKECINVALRLGVIEDLMNGYLGLHNVAANRRNWELSLKLYKQAQIYKDSLNNLNKIRAINKELALNKNVQIERENFILKELNNQKSIQQIILMTGFIIISTFVIFLAFKVIQNRKLNRLLNINISELNDVNERLDQANKSKDKFFSIIAHDLKNPLGNFQNTTKMLVDDYTHFDENERIDMLQLLKVSSSNIYELLDNLLNWAKSQMGAILTNRVDIDVYYTLQAILDLIKPTLSNKKINVLNKVQPNTYWQLDPFIINTVLRNILTNAIKFTPKNGLIEISNTISDTHLVIIIKDNGIGMDNQKIQKLFKINESVSSPGTEGEPSTGLGLVLCHELIHKINGEIDVESELGIGSTFYIKFPKSEVKRTNE